VLVPVFPNFIADKSNAWVQAAEQGKALVTVPPDNVTAVQNVNKKDAPEVGSVPTTLPAVPLDPVIAFAF
jgi:hypothetical protein